MDNFESQKTLTAEQRMSVIKNTFIAKTEALYQPHARFRGNDPARAMYLNEIAEQLNDRLPVMPNAEALTAMLRNIWRQCTRKHDSSYYFPISLVSKAAADIAKEHFRVHNFAPNVSKQGKKQEQSTGDKSKPETQGWTIEKAQAHIDKTQAMIASGELPYSIGKSLINIPRVALARLQAQQADNVSDFDMI